MTDRTTKTRAELADLMLRMLDRGWKPCDDVLCQVAIDCIPPPETD